MEAIAHIGTTMLRESLSDSAESLARRQIDDGREEWFWYTKTGLIIKYTLFFAFLLLLAAWLIGGRTHAKRRLRRGQKPMAYHAWLLSRQERAQVDPAYAWPQASYGVYRPVYGGNGGGDQYGMHSMPPPVYDPSRPPVYDGPPAGSKVDPSQAGAGFNRQGGGDEYAPPAGPPPGR
ncbi:hypothetical protein F5Y19DRAFT_455923 [Xylariaceae sp. FL1651]|nr:hypothetical protein F5Y19DRAFT_455923 [Xylariaceae sp. FL1651]